MNLRIPHSDWGPSVCKDFMRIDNINVYRWRIRYYSVILIRILWILSREEGGLENLWFKGFVLQNIDLSNPIELVRDSWGLGGCLCVGGVLYLNSIFLVFGAGDLNWKEGTNAFVHTKHGLSMGRAELELELSNFSPILNGPMSNLVPRGLRPDLDIFKHTGELEIADLEIKNYRNPFFIV